MPNLTIQNTQNGPLIDVTIGVSSARARALAAANQPIPNVVRARMLIDTGASLTCVDHQIIPALALVQTGTTPMHTPSTGTSPATAPLYDVWVTVLHTALSRNFDPIAVAACDFAAQGIQGLIGRDLLSGCIFTYNGEANVFTLSF